MPETPASAQVLIIGAGPTGLTTANALAQLGVGVRIIDKAPTRSDKSKALGVQAGTLEALDDFFGPDMSAEMVQTGFPTRSAMLHIGNRKPLAVDLSAIPSRYNFILILEQSETERILEENLAARSVSVERETELVSLDESQDSRITARIRDSDGSMSEVNADYVIGCDGAHSRVRDLAGIPFQGDTYEGEFILGDVEVSWPWEYGTVRNFANDQGIVAGFPMRGERRYRLILIQPGKSPATRSVISLEEFQAIAQKIIPAPIQLQNPVWLTRFRVARKSVTRYRQGRIFLAGDAAHIHSPAGGQGMNTGMQDGLNLAHKLAQVLLHGQDPALLDDYQKERLPVARAVTRATDFFFRLALLKETPVVNWTRTYLFPALVKQSWLSGKVVRAISEVRVARREIRDRHRDEFKDR